MSVSTAQCRAHTHLVHNLATHMCHLCSVAGEERRASGSTCEGTPRFGVVRTGDDHAPRGKRVLGAAHRALSVTVFSPPDTNKVRTRCHTESARTCAQNTARTRTRVREKTSLYGELEMINRLFRENQATGCQEIEQLRRLCCEETDLARQARIDELEPMNRYKDFQTCSVFACRMTMSKIFDV